MPKRKSLDKYNKSNIMKERESQSVENYNNQEAKSIYLKDIEFICFIGIKCVSSLYKSIMTRLNKLLTFTKFDTIFKDFYAFSKKVLEMKLCTISRTLKGLSYFLKRITGHTLKECNKNVKCKMFSDKNDTTNKIKNENFINKSDSSDPNTNKENLLSRLRIELDEIEKLSIKYKKRRYNNREKIIQSKFLLVNSK
jgi:hypothetical protein